MGQEIGRAQRTSPGEGANDDDDDDNNNNNGKVVRSLTTN